MHTGLLAALAALGVSSAIASRLTPPVLPLVVRNPYLSTWLPNARDEPWTVWPMFWEGANQGFSVLASLPHDNTVYPLLGRPHDSLSESDEGYNISYPTYLGAQYDASTTNLTYRLQSTDAGSSSGHVEITLSFLSPITPTSTLRQSIPASYLTIYVAGTLHANVYVDVNGQWVSGDRGNKITWDLHHHDLDGHGQRLKTWAFQRETEQVFTENHDQSEWGTLHFSAPSGVRHESGTSAQLRRRFSRTGTLQNQNDNAFRGIMDEEPVFAFAKSFGHNATDASYEESVTFTIAHIQDPVIQFAAARGLTFLRPLWRSYFPTDGELLTFHYQDFKHAKTLAEKYSAQLAKDAFQSGAEDYVDIVSISARQVMGATHFVGTPDDPLLFLKEISSDGNTQTIDVIFPAFPFFMYTNPRWLAYMLEPIFEHIGSGQYPNKYAIHDLGAHYPNATGHPDGNDERMPVEECGNILIMGLAMANAIRDGTNSSVSSTWRPMAQPERSQHHEGDKQSFFPLTVGQDQGMVFIDDSWIGTSRSLKQAKQWVQHNYPLWKQWTQYLVDFGLRPEHQLSTDDFAGPLALQTNLALKGIIGIKAMAGLADMVGQKKDFKAYTDTSNEYITKWEKYGIARDGSHAKLAYDWYGSWTTLYNLYADSLLCFHLGQGSDKAALDVGRFAQGGRQQPLQRVDSHKGGFVPQHIYQKQSDWYFNVRQKYGLPMDSRHLYTKTDWEFFAMAVAAPRVRADILQSVARWVNETNTDRPLTDLHQTEGRGEFPGPNFFARPVIGGHFAFLTLERACGGKAMGGLEFLQDPRTLDVPTLLALEVAEGAVGDETL